MNSGRYGCGGRDLGERAVITNLLRRDNMAFLAAKSVIVLQRGAGLAKLDKMDYDFVAQVAPRDEGSVISTKNIAYSVIC